MVDSILLVLEDADGIINRYITINGYIRDLLSDPKRYIYNESILDRDSYYISYKEEKGSLILITPDYEDQGK